MLRIIKKYKKLLIIIMDVLLIPAGIICEKLTDNMLAVDDPCMWTLAGGKCATCGGTHFVNSLMNGHIIEAFHHNEYLFLLTVYLLVTIVLANIAVLAEKKMPAKILSHMYNVPAILTLCVLLLLFLILRNIPLWIRIAEVIANKL